MVVLVGAGEVQSNVTDITSGHSAAADRLAGERLRDVRLGQQALLSTLSYFRTLREVSWRQGGLNCFLVVFISLPAWPTD